MENKNIKNIVKIIDKMDINDKLRLAKCITNFSKMKHMEVFCNMNNEAYVKDYITYKI